MVPASKQSNAHLQDQLYAMNERLKEEKSVDPCDLRSRLENVTRAIRSGAVSVRVRLL